MSIFKIYKIRYGRYINWGNLPRWRYVIRSPGKKMRASVCHMPLPLTLVWSGLNKIIHRKQSNSNSPDRIFILTAKSSTPILFILLSLMHQFLERPSSCSENVVNEKRDFNLYLSFLFFVKKNDERLIGSKSKRKWKQNCGILREFSRIIRDVEQG